jgi:hypothetical protein
MEKFVLGGRSFELEKEGILNAAKGVHPTAIYDFSVNLNGKMYPIKQAISLATELSQAKFTSSQAHGILRKLGFTIENLVDEERKRKQKIRSSMGIETKWVG